MKRWHFAFHIQNCHTACSSKLLLATGPDGN